MNSAISTYWLFALGFFAQMLFGGRVLVQWWFAEKKKQVVSPSLYWNLSLVGSALFLVYGILRQDLVIIIGQLISYFIYVRNLQLKEDWRTYPLLLRVVIVAIPLISVVYIAIRPPEGSFESLGIDRGIFFFVGLVGQLLLNFRFLYQLYYSERLKRSVLPVGFWWISLSGSLAVIVYAVHRHDPVLLVAQAMAIIPYVRNVVLSSHNRQHA